MRKKIFMIFILLLLFKPLSVMASNEIYNIDIDVYLNKNGDADITEIWHVNGEDGTEWYKVINNISNSEISNYKVSMDGKELQYKNWNVNESLKEKKGYYGINYTSTGLELCFGKYDYNEHTFTLNYTLSNLVFNTEDSQVIYYNFIDKLNNVDFDSFSLDITSFYQFPDTLDVWGYGYKGYAYVKDGKISMSNAESMDDQNVVLLAKFPLSTFQTTNTYSEYPTFSSVLERAEENSFEYDYNETSIKTIILDILAGLLNVTIFFIPVIVIMRKTRLSSYGYKDNKKIEKNNVPMFRELPCNKDVYYANALIKLNNFSYKESNILGAILLKWVKEDKIEFKEKETKGIIKKEESVIDLTKNPTFENTLEKELFDMMYQASDGGILESKELEKWCKSHYDKYLDLFKKLVDTKVNELKTSGHIYTRKNKKECKYKNVMDNLIYDDSVKLYGLKKYLMKFSEINTKEVMEVKLWDEYLMFAYLFGIADKVLKQLKNLYPEFIEQENINVDYNTMIFINNVSRSSISAANNARIAASNYSGGGGGFSSGGGGGGSFGGGGGGSR